MGNAGSIITEAKSRGNTFFQSKKYRSAVAHYRHALATESGGAEAHLLYSNLAAVYTAAHFPASALSPPLSLIHILTLPTILLV